MISTSESYVTSEREQIQQLLEKSSALAREGLHKENESLLREALQRFPNEPELCIRTALAIIEDSPEEAKELIRRTVTITPDDPWNLTRCASVMFYLEEFEQARSYVRRASENAPEDFEFAAGLAHLGGRLAAQQGNDAFAEELLIAAFEEEPESVPHGRVLAEFLAARGRLVEALEILSEAQHHLPDDESLKGLRAELLERARGNWQEHS